MICFCQYLLCAEFSSASVAGTDALFESSSAGGAVGNFGLSADGNLSVSLCLLSLPRGSEATTVNKKVKVLLSQQREIHCHIKIYNTHYTTRIREYKIIHIITNYKYYNTKYTLLNAGLKVEK